MRTQKFSTFHDTEETKLKSWHDPYADLFLGCSPVLDIGCGPGYFQELLSERGITSHGIDSDPEMVTLAVSRGQNAVLGTQLMVADFKEHFLGIHISHVLEHLWGDEVLLLLVDCVSALKPGGLLVIRTPNWQNRKVRQFLFWMDHTHKRPYPAELLVRIAGDLGLRVVASGHEPFGMEDVYFVAEKSGTNASPTTTGARGPVFSKPHQTITLVERFRRKVRYWLDDAEAW